MTAEQITQVLKTLEDPDSREQVLQTLRALQQVSTENPDSAADQASVKTAAAALVSLVAEQAREASRSASHFLESLAALPTALKQWALNFQQADHRQRWFTILGRLAMVLGGGFAAASISGWLLRRLRKKPASESRLPMPHKLGYLSINFFRELVPIGVFALVAYTILAFVDPRHETTLVAVSLINASILSRLVLLLTRFLLSPTDPALRLWTLSNESAQYLYQWTRRLTGIAVYGYFGLQAGLLLGADAATYETLVRGLGLVVLLMLLVLIAQNRADVARSIAHDHAIDVDEPASVSSFRRGLAKVWHLIASLYLIAIFVIWSLKIQDGAGYLLRATLLTLAALAVMRLLSHGLDQLFNHGLRLSDELRSQYPQLEQRLNRYYPVLRKISKVALVVVVSLFIAFAWGIDTLAWVADGSGRVFLGAAIHILLVLGVAFLLWEFASGSIESYLAETDNRGNSRVRSARTKTLLTVARNALMVVLTVITLLMVLSEIGLNIAPLLAGAGVVGLAIGFGSQRLVQDVINGAFILFQDLMSVGDVVKLGDKSGVVEALSIRTVRLRDLAGVVHTIPFSSIEAVSNLTREFSFYVFDMGIAYREDVDEVIALIKQVGEELQADPDIGPLVLEPVEVFGLDQFGDSAIVIKGRIKTKPIKQWAVGRAFNRLIKIHFDANNIEIPFPHQTLYFGENKDGSAPAAHIRWEQAVNDSQMLAEKGS